MGKWPGVGACPSLCESQNSGSVSLVPALASQRPPVGHSITPDHLWARPARGDDLRPPRSSSGGYDILPLLQDELYLCDEVGSSSLREPVGTSSFVLSFDWLQV